MKYTNIYFDFEFIDDGREIVPISLGMCTDDREELYIEYEFDPARASDWVREHVFPRLECNGGGYNAHRIVGDGMSRRLAASKIEVWVKEVCGAGEPQFWGYYPSYDWVLLCQHFGTMMQLPDGWPMRPECAGQLADTLSVGKSYFPEQEGNAHYALSDARWIRSLVDTLYVQHEADAP